jgi:hypothetical protein
MVVIGFGMSLRLSCGARCALGGDAARLWVAMGVGGDE